MAEHNPQVEPEPEPRGEPQHVITVMPTDIVTLTQVQQIVDQIVDLQPPPSIWFSIFRRVCQCICCDIFVVSTTEGLFIRERIAALLDFWRNPSGTILEIYTVHQNLIFMAQALAWQNLPGTLPSDLIQECQNAMEQLDEMRWRLEAQVWSATGQTPAMVFGAIV
jgi:hypothetical protein